jgi:arylsulfatase A-like enzyme/putative flippase GtrA
MLRRPARISFILIYSVIYLFAIISFIRTDQIFRIQTIIFLLGMGPLRAALAAIGGLILIGIIFVFFLNKKSTVKDLRGKKRNKVKVLFWFNLLLFLLAFGVNVLFLNLDAAIIDDTNSLIAYDYQDILLEDLSNLTEKFGGKNIVFVLLESVSADRLGYYGNPRDVSNNIDRLAEKSIVFRKAYSTASHSEYAQPALLSSRYMFTSNIRTDLGDLRSPRKFIWDVFKENGYDTGYFSSQDDRWQEMNEYMDTSNLDVYSYGISDGESDYGSSTSYEQKDYDHRTAGKAIDWLNESRENPFFLYLNFQSTHRPYAKPAGYAKYKPTKNKFPGIKSSSVEINQHDNSLRYVDEQIGKIVSLLDEKGVAEDTVIVITSDHGHDLEKRHGVRAHGLTIYDEELLIPAIIYLPGANPHNVVSRVSHIDFVPTLIDLFGYQIPDEFQGEVMKFNRSIYFVTQSHKYMIGMIEKDIKVILDMNTKQVEVYNLREDPGELNNINSKEYNNQILKLLFWRFCQVDYYNKEKWSNDIVDRCSRHNNFKV